MFTFQMLDSLNSVKLIVISLTIASMSLCLNLAQASPNLSSIKSFKEFQGIKFFQDHKDENLFYYVETKKHLVIKDGKPKFQYVMNRFIGNRLTENKDEFSVKGIVKFQIETNSVNINQTKLQSLLNSIHPGKIILKRAPITNTFNKLTYALVNSIDGKEDNGEIDGGFVSDESEDTLSSKEEESTKKFNILAARKQRFTVGLDSHDANLFWEGFTNNKLILSLGYGWEISGVIADINNVWKKDTLLISDSMAIDVSYDKYPELFKKNELWQRVKHAYSTILVDCYDFINAEYSDLYYVKVELRFTTLRKQQYVESVKFTADSDEYEKNVRFKQVNDIENGYEYRIRRLFNNGDQSKSAWIQASNRVIDASLTLEEITALQKHQSDQL